MGLKTFDRKFGADLLRDLSTGPGVYLFKDEEGTVLYAGKAKNIRRRLQTYRNATRRKAHRKMRKLVREAGSLEVRLQPSEREALLLENHLIKTLKPRYNVEGAYSFLYPALGLGRQAHQIYLCFTTDVDRFTGIQLDWFGSFRSRLRAREAYDALSALLARVGHEEPAARLVCRTRMRGAQVSAFRRIEGLEQGLKGLLSGADPGILSEISTRLLAKPDARRDAANVEEELRMLADFFESDARPLRRALECSGRGGHFVAQDERDAVFIDYRYGETTPD